MRNEGPALEVLTRRLADTPPDFLARPGADGQVSVAALVSDCARDLGEALSLAELARFDGPPAAWQNWVSLVAVGCWLTAGGGLGRASRETLLAYFTERLQGLAETGTAEKFVHDPERREELARVTLAAFELRPAGESLAQAQDRLQAISGAERKRLIEAVQAAEKRAREVREALLAKAAAEAADKDTRE